MRIDLTLLVMVCCLLLPTVGWTQAEIPQRPAVSAYLLADRPVGPLRELSRGPAEADSVRRQIRPTHWKEGAVAGGVVGGVGFGLLYRVACGLSEDPGRDCFATTILGGLLGAGLGAIPGALIGGLFPKGRG